MEFNKYIDHTLLKPNILDKDINKLCDEAKHYNFKSVCVNPCYVKLAHSLLENSGVLVCTVIGFPLGATSTKAKIEETKCAINDGAEEIDMVINISRTKEHDYAYLEKEISSVKKVCGERVLKIILETCLLSEDEIVAACLAAKNAGANFVKTSTGFSTSGASIKAVSLMRQTVGPEMGVKASGGIHNFQEAMAMITAGASRIGSSNGVAIMKSLNK